MSDRLDGPWVDVATIIAWDLVAYAARDEREALHGRAAFERLELRRGQVRRAAARVRVAVVRAVEAAQLVAQLGLDS